MTEPTKQETERVFKVLTSQKANKVIDTYFIEQYVTYICLE